MFILILALVVLLDLWQFVAFTYQARSLTVAVSQEGLSWRVGRRTFDLPWEEARGWAVVNLPEQPRWNAWMNQRQSSDSANALYALIGERANLIWTQQPTLAQPAPAHPTLADFVTARGAVPLRDLTESATRLAGELQGRRGREREAALVSPPPASA